MADHAGLGASGWVAINMEQTMGTFLGPDTVGTVWVPILDETVAYTEEPYYSPQIRQEVVDIERTQGFYHVEGDLNMEFDANFAPYFLYCSRHDITATGGSPNTYVFTPSNTGAAFNIGGDNPKTMSITIVRNGIGFGYAGCVFPRQEFTIDQGVLKMNLGVFGLSEQEPLDISDTPVWVAPELQGAAHHTVYTDTAGTAPTFATPSLEFNGFTATFEHNATAENRLTGQRSATYIAYHKTEPTFESELDFIDRDEYDKFVASTHTAVRFESYLGASWAAATGGVRIDFNNAVYDSYPVNLTALEDLIMAQTTGRGLAIAGGDPYSITVKSDVTLAAVRS